MNRILYYMLIMALTVAGLSCIKEDMSDCPPAPPKNMVWLEFECVIPRYDFRLPRFIGSVNSEVVYMNGTHTRLDDAPNREHEPVNPLMELELLFYDGDGNLAYDKKVTYSEFQSNGYRVYLEDEIPGGYTIVALVNYNLNDHISLTAKENRDDLRINFDTDAEHRIDYALPEAFHGVYTIDLQYTDEEQKHIVFLSKNTNYITLVVEFEEEETAGHVTDFKSRVTGNNTTYRWDNTVVAFETAYFIPFRSSFGDGEPVFIDQNKTLRIWMESDLKLEIYITDATQTHSYTLDIPDYLAKVEVNGEHPYDTDEKLEHYDEYEFRLKIDSDFLVTEIYVNDWFDIGDDREL